MRDSATRALVPAVVVLALVGVVAIAAAGPSSTGSNTVRAPSDSITDVVFTIILLAFIPAAILYVYGLLTAPKGAAKGQRLRSLVGFAIFMLIFTLVVYFRLRDWNSPEFAESEIGEPAFPRGEPIPGREAPAGATTYEPEFVGGVVLALAGIVLVGLAIWYVSARREARRLAGDTMTAEAVAQLLDEILAGLRAEKDPRRAVIAAYARLERVLAAHGLARDRSEAPQEYLSRILPRLELERGSVRRLTDLFTRAKFSPHAVDADMKEQAIDALTTVRDELRAAEERRREKELAALETAVERP